MVGILKGNAKSIISLRVFLNTNEHELSTNCLMNFSSK